MKTLVLSAAATLALAAPTFAQSTNSTAVTIVNLGCDAANECVMEGGVIEMVDTSEGLMKAFELANSGDAGEMIMDDGTVAIVGNPVLSARVLEILMREMESMDGG